VIDSVQIRTYRIPTEIGSLRFMTGSLLASIQ
jgi:hypothetical protein